MKAAKTIITLLILLLLAAPLFYSAGLLIRQKLVQHQMEEKLEKASLQTITVSTSSFKWVKEGKEALVQGKLFDVKSFSFSDNKIILTGIYDADEDSIKQKIAEAGNCNSEGSSMVPWVLIVQYYEPATSFTIQQDWKAVAITYPNYADVLNQGVIVTPVQPPCA